MSRALYQSAPAFREVIDRCDLILGEREGRTLRGVLFDPPGDAPAIHETIWTQPALFAVEYALTQLWRSWGIEPAGVIGHSVGEYVAACVAGVFDLEEGLALIAERGRLMQGLPAGGAMAAIFASADEVAAAVAPRADRIAVAAFNAPDNTVIAGDSAAVDQLLAELALRNIQGQRLFVSLAAHSPLTDPILDGMERCAARVEMKAPRIPMVWNLTGQSLPARVAPDAGYWRRHLREPVRFADGMQALHQQGFRAFLEVGPHPTLMALAQRSLPGEDILWLSSLRRGKEDWPEMLASLAALYVHGANVDWVGVDRPYARRRATLPTYPFERKRYWIEPTAPGTVREGPRRTGTHPLLGQRLATADPTFELRVEERSPSYLEQHRIHGQVVVPGPVLLELAQASARDAFGSVGWAVEEFSVHAPLVPGASGRMVQVRLAEGDEHVALRIHSRAPAGGDAWQLHATGRLVRVEGMVPLADGENRVPRQSMTAGLRDEYYARLAGLGIGFGPAFQTIRQAWAGPGQACALIELGEEEAGDPVVWAHPALVDGALQAIGLAIPVTGEAEAALLTGIERVELSTPLPTRVICTVRLRSPLMPPPPEWEADVELWSEEGRRLGVLSGVRLRRAGSAALRRALRMPEAEGLFHQVAWQPAPGTAQPALQLTPVAEVAAPVEQAFSALAREHDLSLYDRLLPELDGLSTSYVHRAFVDLGFDTTAGRRFTGQSEAGRLGVTARQARLFGRLLQMLVEDGVLARNGPDEFTLAGALRVVDVAPHLDSLLTEFQTNDGELSMLRRAGPALARVLRGEQDPLHLLFPGGSFAEARRLYVESAVARTYNGTLVELLRRSLAQLPAGRVLRVLEIGAGTGGTTEYVLPSLAGTRVEYTFTDLSPLFLERATERFGSSPYFRTAILDIERDPGVQGFDARAYDVIIAANVLHATADLERTLSHARGLLAPGGQLCLLEGVAPERWVDLTFGLTEGWWRFSDRTLRPDYPLVDRAAWLGLLDRLNFRDVRAFPDVPTARAARQQVLLVARAPVESRKQWTLLADASGVAEALAGLLTARGDVVTVHPADSDEASSGEVVYLGALDLAGVPASPAEAADCERLSCALPLRLLRGVVRQGGAARAWLVTSSAQGVTVPTETANASQAPLWGLGRVWALEHPECWGGLIDLPSGSPVELADVLLQALDSADQEDQVAWRDGVRYVPRLVRVQPPAVPAPELRGDGAYLVTGGFGGLGLVTARWLAERGAGTIVLLGRRVPEEADGIRDIERAGARVRTVATDVADENAMALLSRRFGTEWPPLRGIVHTAADFSSAPMLDLTDEQVTRMLRAKVAGTVLLSRLAASQPLDFLVLYSSSTAVLGASGFAHYAAANQFLDAFAEAEDRPGRRVLSVNWGTWEVMRGASDAAQQDYRRSGLEPMRTVEALDALGRMLGSDAPRKLVARIDWTRLKPLLESRRARPMLEALDRAAERPAASGPVAAPARGRATLEQLLARRPAAQRHDVLVDFVSREVAEVLGRGTNDPVPPEAGLFELGMDSLMSVELKRRLDAGTGRTLPSTLTFNYPTVSALAGFIEMELGPRATAPVAAPPVMPAADTDESSDEELEARLLAKLEELR
jgi:acyl transferase domain-containing protein